MDKHIIAVIKDKEIKTKRQDWLDVFKNYYKANEQCQTAKKIIITDKIITFEMEKDAS